jgi:hypothetical protein
MGVLRSPRRRRRPSYSVVFALWIAAATLAAYVGVLLLMRFF